MTKLASAVLAAVVATAGIACGGGSEPETPTQRPSLVGTWDLVTVNGASLPAPSPDEENVVLDAIAMTLTAEGNYILSSTFRVGAQAPPTNVDIGGTWSATSDVLTFHGREGPAVVVFGYAMEGNLLSMTDEQGHEWMMRRR